MVRSILPPYLKSVGSKKLCSACSHPFDPKMQSLGAAFRKHVEEVHRTGESADDANPPALGVTKKQK